MLARRLQRSGAHTRPERGGGKVVCGTAARSSGAGHEMGETRSSRSGIAPFTRATPNRPLATAAIFYNDRTGIEAMANTRSCNASGPYSQVRRRR